MFWKILVALNAIAAALLGLNQQGIL